LAGGGGGGKTAGLGSMAIPGLLLAALAVGAFLFARRRRATIHRHIEILETTSLGPKRSLVVARIGDETMVLGISEAGIALLRGSATAAASLGELVQATPAAIPSGAALPVSASAGAAAGLGGAGREKLELDAANRELAQPLQEALADIPEPDGGRGGAARAAFRAIEGGLAGLFDRRGAGAFDKDPNVESFEDLLEDSVEDQELRRKLAAGMSARVR